MGFYQATEAAEDSSQLLWLKGKTPVTSSIEIQLILYSLQFICLTWSLCIDCMRLFFACTMWVSMHSNNGLIYCLYATSCCCLGAEFKIMWCWGSSTQSVDTGLPKCNLDNDKPHCTPSLFLSIYLNSSLQWVIIYHTPNRVKAPTLWEEQQVNDV